MVQRGALIVFEGCDRCGKTTQAKLLVESLVKHGLSAKMMRFPERSTTIGGLINDYLTKKSEMDDHVVHLLFSANRWEARSDMLQQLEAGTTLVVDRYAYSGVAFTAAKQGFSLEWCKQPDVGLPEPDIVFNLTLSPEVMAQRGDFGQERYEKSDFQARVADNFNLLRDHSWTTIDADKTIEDLQKELKTLALDVIAKAESRPIGTLWSSPK